MAEQPTLKRKSDLEPDADPKKPKAPGAQSPTAAVGASEAAREDGTHASPTQAKAPQQEKSPQASKPVFGAASTFGNAAIFDRMKKKANVFDSASPEKDAAPSTASLFGSFGASTSFGGSFGANSKFGGAFQSATLKKSFLDEPSTEDDKSKSPSAAPATQQYKQVELAAQDVKTGEENERSVFSTTAKLFELDFSNIKDGWKERGLGPLHLNQAVADPAQVRMVMRSQGLLRVILNHKVASSTVLIKGLEASLSPGKFLRMNSLSADKKPIQYLLKFSNEGVRDEFYDKVEELKGQVLAKKANGTERKDPRLDDHDTDKDSGDEK